MSGIYITLAVTLLIFGGMMLFALRLRRQVVRLRDGRGERE